MTRARTLVTHHGRYQVIAERLSDGGEVHCVEFPSDDGPLVIIACTSLVSAAVLASNLNTHAVDVSLRDLGTDQ